MAFKNFTNTSINDAPPGMTNEEYTRMYAAWGRFVDLSSRLIPWNKFLDYGEQVDEVVGWSDSGEAIVETTIKLKYTTMVNEEVLDEPNL